jgi:GntR family transcriptional regulator, N-acetylglucosamine utilization regulator
MTRVPPPAPTQAPSRTDAPSAGPSSRRIRRDLPVPYYAQLSRILERDIAELRWHPGEALPSEAELCAEHGLSRTAVRQALAELATRGLLRKEKGRRTLVARSHVTNLVVQELRGFYEEVSDRGAVVETTILQQTIVTAPPHVADDLEVPSGSELVLLERLRTVDGDTIVRVETYLPAPRFASLVSMDLSHASLYAVLGAEFGVRPSSGRRVIEAVAAEQGLGEHLDIPAGSPVLQLSAVNRDQDGVPFESFQAWYRGDETRFELIVGS